MAMSLDSGAGLPSVWKTAHRSAAARAARSALASAVLHRAPALAARTCDLRSLGSLFYRRQLCQLDRTGCSISRPLPGHAELVTARCEAPGTTPPPVIRYAEPRGNAESASTKVERSKGWMGTTNECERPRKRRNARQAKRADRLEPKGMRRGMVL